MRNNADSSYPSFPMPPALNLRLLKQTASLVLALFVLNFALTFHNVWPTLAITTRFELSVEIAILVLVLAVFFHFRRRIRPALLLSLAAVLTLMTLARYVEVTAPALFGRRVNLYWDARYLPHVTEMLAESTHPLLLVLFIAGALLLLGLIFTALYFSLRRLTRGFARPLEFRLLCSLMAALTFAYFMGHLNQPVHTLKYYSLPLSLTYWQQVQFINSVMANEASDVIPDQSSLKDYDLSALQGSDVIVQFIESYGATAFDNPTLAYSIGPALENFTNSIRETERRVVSAFVEAPTFGGNSWLSHSSFMTGLDINHLSTYNLLMTQNRTTLSDKFSTRGFRPVALMPGLRADWPEGAFYGFESIYGAEEINYQGPEFGWWRIPDQFSLQKMHELEFAVQPRDPLFMLFTSITPHMPFRPTPPYQPDWDRLLSDKPYDEEAVQNALDLLPEWTNLQPAYAGTLNYTFAYLSGYLSRHADDDFVWVILGDHQPPASVSGQDVRWDVPVHIVSDRNEIIESLLDSGFVEGLQPEPAPLSKIYLLPDILLSAFSSRP